VARANTLFVRVFGDRAVVNPQNPLQLSDWTEPQPDIVILKPRPDFYEHLRPTPGDVLLVMEVSDTTLQYDLKIKLTYFAAASIPEVWIQDVNEDVLHVFRQPRGGNYSVSMRLNRGSAVSPVAFPEVQFSMNDLFGQP
jgi:Uma2 family endonuclease